MSGPAPRPGPPTLENVTGSEAAANTSWRLR